MDWEYWIQPQHAVIWLPFMDAPIAGFAFSPIQAVLILALSLTSSGAFASWRWARRQARRNRTAE